MAGRPRKPVTSHQASGAIAKNPARFRDRDAEPRPTSPLGTPPEWFREVSVVSQAHLSIWFELEAQVPEGVITGSDRFIFELTCRLMYRVRNGSVKTGEFAQLKVCLSELGLTPAARTRVAIHQAKDDKGTPEGWAALADERLSVKPVQ